MDATASEGGTSPNAGQVPSRQSRGRHRLVTPDRSAQIAELRSHGSQWKEIGLRLGLNPETCRRAFWAHKMAQKTVGFVPEAPQKGAEERPAWLERAYRVARAARLLRREQNSELPSPED